jgi:mycothiol system anti-sigma-R factor
VSHHLDEADCSEALHRVFEYLDGEMGSDDSAKIAAHLAHCAACLQQYDLDTMVKALVKRSCPPESAPTHLRAMIVQRITTIEVRYSD